MYNYIIIFFNIICKPVAVDEKSVFEKRQYQLKTIIMLVCSLQKICMCLKVKTEVSSMFLPDLLFAIYFTQSKWGYDKFQSGYS